MKSACLRINENKYNIQLYQYRLMKQHHESLNTSKVIAASICSEGREVPFSSGLRRFHCRFADVNVDNDVATLALDRVKLVSGVMASSSSMSVVIADIINEFSRRKRCS